MENSLEIGDQTLPQPPDVLVFTDAAAGKVGELIREESNPNLKLRVFVSGGGCSGFQYGFTFDENVEEGDFCVEKRGVHAADRPDERAIPHGRGNRLQGRFAGRPIRHPQPERQDNLRLRVLVLRLRMPAV